MLQFWPTKTDGVHIVLIERAAPNQAAVVRHVGVLWLTEDIE